MSSHIKKQKLAETIKPLPEPITNTPTQYEHSTSTVQKQYEPSTKSVQKLERYDIRLAPDTWKMLGETADEEGTSRGALIRRAIKKMFG